MRNFVYCTFAYCQTVCELYAYIQTVFLVLLFAGLGLSMLIRLSLTTKSFRRTLLNHFISKVLHDSFSFRCEVLANGPHLRQVRFSYFLPNLLLRMRRKRPQLSFWH